MDNKNDKFAELRARHQPENPIENSQTKKASTNNENWNIQGQGDIEPKNK
jgi:hypothetical protein